VQARGDLVHVLHDEDALCVHQHHLQPRPTNPKSLSLPVAQGDAAFNPCSRNKHQGWGYLPGVYSHSLLKP
jgi:hypothetical protein